MAFQAYRRSSLWFVFLCCLVEFFTSQQVSAQVKAEKRSFDVSEGYAINTLKEAAQQAGVEFIFSADLVKGVRTSSIQGEYLPHEAFSLMLVKTSLTVFQHEKTGVYTVSRALDFQGTRSEQEPQNETEMKVKNNHWFKALIAAFALGVNGGSNGLSGQSNPENEIYDLNPFDITENPTEGYGAVSTGSSGRLNTAYLDVPQVTDVLTEEFLRDANLFDIRNALAYVNNVQPNNNYHANDYWIRGITTNTTYTDGFRGGATSTFDTFFTDRIEVVKGPSSATFGRGDPLGIINFVTKRPHFNPHSEIGVHLGTEDNYRFEFDHEVDLVEDKVGLRALGVFHSGADPKELTNFETRGFMLSGVYRPNANTQFNSSMQYMNQELPSIVASVQFHDDFTKQELRNRVPTVIDYPITDPRRTFAFEGDVYNVERFVFTNILTHRFNDVASTRQGLYYYRYDRAGDYTILNPPNLRLEEGGGITADVIMRRAINHEWDLRYQSDFLFEYEDALLNGTHSTLFGLEYFQGESRGGSSTTVLQDRVPWPDFDRRFRPTYEIPPDSSFTLETADESMDVFLQQDSRFFEGKLGVHLGVRKSWDYERDDSTRIIPRYAVTLKPVDTVSFYALYAKHKDPTRTVPEWIGLLEGDPRINNTINTAPDSTLKEFGVKAQLLERKIFATVSYFDFERLGNVLNFPQNERQPDGTELPVTQRVLSGEDVTGWEGTLFGNPVENLTLMASFSTIEGTQPTPGQPGGTFTEIAGVADTAQVRARYSFQDSDGKGFEVRGGLKVFFSGWNYKPQQNFFYPDDKYLTDAGVRYFFDPNTSLDFHIQNAFDELIVTGNGNGMIKLRQAFLTLRKRF